MDNYIKTDHITRESILRSNLDPSEATASRDDLFRICAEKDKRIKIMREALVYIESVSFTTGDKTVDYVLACTDMKKRAKQAFADIERLKDE